MTDKKQAGPLSHSSANSLLGCEQKYVHYKVLATKTDKDYEPSTALAIGKAFHSIMEKSKHEKPGSISTELYRCEKDTDIGLKEANFPLVHAMVLKYLRLHKSMNLNVLAVETELRTDWFLGYVDAIMSDENDKWWIVDLKTYKSLYLPGLPSLVRDPQLTLYAGHAALIAETLGLDLKSFGGCRWRVTTKSTAKQKAGESNLDFTKRLADKYIKSYDIPVPVEMMEVDERMEIHSHLYSRTQELFDGAPPLRNYSNCMSFFSPCQYWSQCHGGKCYSEFEDALNITAET